MRARVLLAVVAGLVPALAAAQAAVIRVGPGPGGNARVSTPWGDYIAMSQGGAILVIPESQYSASLIQGHARQNGMEEVNLVGGKSFISKSDVRVDVGPTRLRQVESSIVIGVPADKKIGRPPKPKTSEYVSVVWNQQGNGQVGATLAVDGQTIRPNNCGSDSGFFHCEFTVPREQLTKPTQVVFTQRGETPGLWGVPSLARAHYDGLVAKYRMLKIPLAGEDKTDLAAVHAIDPSVPVSID
jgi:hypothetical protein